MIWGLNEGFHFITDLIFKLLPSLQHDFFVLVTNLSLSRDILNQVMWN